MALYSSYVDEIRDNLNYTATWLPTVILRAGDVCDISGGQLRRVGSLAEYGIQPEVANSDVRSEIHYASAGSVTINVKAKGDPPPSGSLLSLSEAGIALAFNRSGAVVLQLTGCTGSSIRNLRQVGDAVLDVYHRREWTDGYVVVTETVLAGASTILISSESGASIDLIAGGAAAAAGITLASLNAGLDVKSQSKIGAQFISAPGLTPLVRTSGVKPHIFRPDTFRGAAVAPFEFVDVDVDYDTVLNQD